MTRRPIAIEAVRARHRASLLEIERLTKVFEPGRACFTVLDRLDLQILSGEFLCILGRSGCGKSTLLKIVAGFLAPSSGRVRIHGRNITGAGPDRCVVFQEDALFPWLNVEENVAFGLRQRKMGRRAERLKVDRFLDMVGLRAFRHYLPRELSGGMKQRVALVRVLILEPEVLLMDEPFAALDAQTREEMQDLLLDLWGELRHTVLFVTHDVAEAIVLADRVVLMDKHPGRIKDALAIHLPRPRNPETPGFVDFYRLLRQILI